MTKVAGREKRNGVGSSRHRRVVPGTVVTAVASLATGGVGFSASGSSSLAAIALRGSVAAGGRPLE